MLFNCVTKVKCKTLLLVFAANKDERNDCEFGLLLTGGWYIQIESLASKQTRVFQQYVYVQ